MVMRNGRDELDEHADLVTAARAGSQDAFGELFENYYPLLHRMLLLQGAEEQLAQDIAQETFLLAYRKLDQLRDVQRFRPWLYQIARNLLYRSWRRDHLRRLVSFEAIRQWTMRATSQRPSEIDEYPTREAIYHSLKKLSRSQREVLTLRYAGGYSINEIAEIVGISPAAAQRRAHRAKTEFQRHYQACMDLDDDMVESPLMEAEHEFSS